MILKPFYFCNMKNNPEKMKEIIKKYDSTSDFYDERYSKIQDGKFIIVLKDFIFNGKYIIDAGCGTGLFYEFFQKKLVTKSNICFKFIGVDISWNMLKKFQFKIQNKEKIVNDQINLVLSDLENLPFRKNVFHSFFSLTSFQNLSNIIQGVNESFRVTINNGEMKFSILKKKLDSRKMTSLIQLKADNLEIIDKEDLEDIIYDFNLRKKKQ